MLLLASCPSNTSLPARQAHNHSKEAGEKKGVDLPMVEESMAPEAVSAVSRPCGMQGS